MSRPARLSPARVPENIKARSAAKTSSARLPAKQLPGSISVNRLRAVRSMRLNTRFSIQPDFAHEPVIAHARRAMHRRPSTAAGSPSAAEHDDAEFGLVEAQMQDRVVELARHRERPEIGAGGMNSGKIGRYIRCGPRTVISAAAGRGRARPGDADRRSRRRRSCGRAAAARCLSPPQGGPRTRPAPVRARAIRSSQAEGGATSSTSRQSTARRPRTPSSVAQNTSARSRRTLRLSVRRVSPPVPGSTAEQRHLGQRHRRAAVVDQHDPVAGQRQLVAAAGRGAADRREIALSGILRRVLDRQPRLVGEFAEIDLVRRARLWRARRYWRRRRTHCPCPSGSRRTRTSGCSKRSRCTASANSISTPRS